MKNADLFGVKDSMFSDNGYGIVLQNVANTIFSDIKFNAFSENLGNPSGCTDPKFNVDCRPADPKVCT